MILESFEKQIDDCFVALVEDSDAIPSSPEIFSTKVDFPEPTSPIRTTYFGSIDFESDMFSRQSVLENWLDLYS